MNVTNLSMWGRRPSNRVDGVAADDARGSVLNLPIACRINNEQSIFFLDGWAHADEAKHSGLLSKI
jgi:hypothetical protein